MLLHLRLVLLAEKSWRYLKYLHIREGLLIAREVRSVLSIRRHVKKAEALFWDGTTCDALALWRALLARFPNDEALAGRARFAISILERLSDVEGYERRIDAYRNSRASRLLEQGREPRIAVYTAIAGGYDSVALPQFLDSRFDYVLFTDCPVPDTGVWQVRPMTYINADGARSARFVKTHPHRFLRDFDIAV